MSNLTERIEDATKIAKDAYRAGLAEGFRRGVQAAADVADAHIAKDEHGHSPCYYEQGHECAESIAGAIRALRPEGEK